MIKDNNKKTHYVVLGGKGGGQAESVEWNDILNKPEFATVATTGDYDDLTDKPTILTQWFGTQAEYDAIETKDPNTIYNIEGSDNVQADWNQTDSSADDFIKNKPTIPAAQVNADWNSNSGVSQILNKPSLATVATSGNYSDLNGTPTLATVATSGDYDDLTNKPTIPVVPTNVSAFTNDAGYTTFDGDYNSLTNKPTIPAAQVNSDWNASSGVSQILNKPTLATVATSGDYDDLTNKPTIPAAQVNSDWNSNSGVSQILNKPSLATVATSGDYDDLQNKPTIPAAQVQSDWNEADSSSLAYIANKPTIPTVPAMATETLTFTLQGDTTKTVVFYVIPNYFYVEDISGSDNTLSIKKNASVGSNIELFYSSDKINWVSMGTTGYNIDVTATIPANSKLYLKGNGDNFINTIIKASGNFNVGGNIMSLLYGDYFDGKTVFPSNSSTFGNVFYESTKLTNAKDLILPITTLTDSCYQFMFNGCTSLTTAPELPATTLANSCYNGMFQRCTSLTTAPELPATTLANSCYANMFNGCTSLTTAPALPATTLADNCYNGMFQRCTSLTTAPVTLPATNTIGNNGYANMFNGCTSLTTAPVLHVTTLPNSYGYYSTGYCEGMFSGCSNLNKITTYIQTIGAKSLDNWLNNVAASGDFYNLGGATYPSGASGIPEGWTIHTNL